MQTRLSSLETTLNAPNPLPRGRAFGRNVKTSLMEMYFPMDVDSVKKFAVAKNMTCEHLKQFAQTLGLSIKSCGRRGTILGLPRETPDRIVFGIKKPAMKLLQPHHTVVRSNLFKFGVSVKTGLFNASESPLYLPTVNYVALCSLCILGFVSSMFILLLPSYFLSVRCPLTNTQCVTV